MTTIKSALFVENALSDRHSLNRTAMLQMQTSKTIAAAKNPRVNRHLNLGTTRPGHALVENAGLKSMPIIDSHNENANCHKIIISGSK